MARWIDASPEQRLHQYTLPAARREVADAPQMFAEYAVMLKRAWEDRKNCDAPFYSRRAMNRRVKKLIAEIRSHQRSVQWSKGLIAKHSK